MKVVLLELDIYYVIKTEAVMKPKNCRTADEGSGLLTSAASSFPVL